MNETHWHTHTIHNSNTNRDAVVLTYITEPYTSNGRKHNCLKIQWPDLLNDTVTDCLKPHTEQGGSSDTKTKSSFIRGG